MISSVVVSMVRLHGQRGYYLGGNVKYQGKCGRRDANTDYKILVALPPTQSGYSSKLSTSSGVPKELRKRAIFDGFTLRSGNGVRLMTSQQDLLFTDLNALTEEQIEAGLAAGVWRENRPFVEQYLDQIRLSRADAAASAQGLEAIRSVVNDARTANFRATIALMFAAGAMLAAMAGAFIAFLALSGVKIVW
jgi:hypothetical protein